MTLPKERAAQGGLERIAHVDRVASLTGIRAVAALLVVGTHAAYTTGKYTHGYWGLMSSRMEIGVPIFFVLSGFLLFRPWVKSAATGGPAVVEPLCVAPGPADHARLHRHRSVGLPRLSLPHGGAQPGHTWVGLFRNLTLTQIYTDGYLGAFLHQGLTQMWSLAVEVAFYLALPALAYLLLVLVCRRRWQPRLLLATMAGLTMISPAWLILVHNTHWMPDGARLWLPTYLAWFVGGMMLAVLAAMGVRCYAFVAIPLAVICYFIVSTPIAGAPTTSPTALAEALVKTAFYAVIAVLAVAPLALGDQGWYAQLLASRPMVFLGEISYEIFLIHLVTMEIAMVDVLGYRVYTSSMVNLCLVTLVLTIPLAWLLHRFTRVQGDRPS